MDNVFAKAIEYIPMLAGLLILIYGLSQARRATNDIVNNIDKFGGDHKGKRIVVSKAIMNFYLVLGGSIIFAMRMAGYIGNEVFLVMEFGVLAALGIKVTLDAVSKAGGD